MSKLKRIWHEFFHDDYKFTVEAILGTACAFRIYICCDKCKYKNKLGGYTKNFLDWQWLKDE